MSDKRTQRADYYNALKELGVEFDKPFREYSVEELREAHQKFVDAGVARPLGDELPAPEPPPGPSLAEQAAMMAQAARQPSPPPDPDAAAFFGYEAPSAPESAPVQQLAPPVAEKDPNEMAGARQNTKHPDEPIRTDEQGRIWFQEEVAKPSYAKPRGRRVLDYVETGAQTKTVRDIDGKGTSETFEVAGSQAPQRMQIKITLPSFQVGIYKDPRFPFKVVTYGGNNGFMREEVQAFYGGAELVPDEIKKVYVENVLCYDVRTTIRAIQDEHRQLQLRGIIQ